MNKKTITAFKNENIKKMKEPSRLRKHALPLEYLTLDYLFLECFGP